VGIQHLSIIREGNFAYVDKTEHIHRFASIHGYYFLSRPRRFGKSLVLDTLHRMFEGRKDLFSGLWIENNWDWEQKYPVIRISFSSIGTQTKGLTQAILDALDKIAKAHHIELSEKDPGIKFEELILKMAQDKQVVLLIDEYDKPIIDNLENIELAQENRRVMKSFYSVLKDLGEKIRLLFITGVSKFSQVSIFSDLNNLIDLSLRRDMGELVGITQVEMERYFPQELALCDRDELRRWYNGYTWDLQTSVYNPFSLLSFFSDLNHYQNYWFSTGTPTFLIDILKKHHLTHFDRAEISASVLKNFDFEQLNPYTLLFQTGYLTLESYNADFYEYTLRIPNLEVGHSLHSHLLDGYMNMPIKPSSNLITSMSKAFQRNDFSNLQHDLNEVFQGIDFQFWENTQEKFYHGIIHLVFNLIGVFVQSEVRTNRGLCDAVVRTPEHIYVLEFKMNQSAQAALNSIHERGYLEKFKNEGKKLSAMGINLDGDQRKIDDFALEVIL
jgi:hypothetical protein